MWGDVQLRLQSTWARACPRGLGIVDPILRRDLPRPMRLYSTQLSTCVPTRAQVCVMQSQWVTIPRPRDFWPAAYGQMQVVAQTHVHVRAGTLMIRHIDEIYITHPRDICKEPLADIFLLRTLYKCHAGGSHQKHVFVCECNNLGYFPVRLLTSLISFLRIGRNGYFAY